MNIFKLSVKNLFYRPLSSLLSLLLLALGVSMISLLVLINSVVKDQMNNNLKGIDMVVGAKGSPLQLILSSVYHVDSPTGNISLKEARSIEKNPMVGNSVPLLYGDNYEGFRIVGTNEKFIELYNLSIENGSFWDDEFEVVVGKKIATKLNLNVGDTFVTSHGLRQTGETHADTPFTVVGITNFSNSVADQLILTSAESVWGLHGDHTHDDEEHEHGDDKEITAMLIKFNSPMNVIRFPRYINENTNLQSAVPSYEISRLFKLFGFGIETINLLAYLIIVVSGISIFITLFNSMKERKYDMALIRTLGGTRLQLSSMLIYEGLILTVSGFILGIILSRLGLVFISSLMESSFNYSLNSYGILIDEFWLLAISILIGLIACLIPSIQVYKMDISKTLSNE
ncbi:MAG: ABC transporter permease [Flavobacteriaceae bacterium]|nr:ABC transporter permease [Flavobacteriaceae bacterium]